MYFTALEVVDAVDLFYGDRLSGWHLMVPYILEEPWCRFSIWGEPFICAQRTKGCVSWFEVLLEDLECFFVLKATWHNNTCKHNREAREIAARPELDLRSSRKSIHFELCSFIALVIFHATELTVSACERVQVSIRLSWLVWIEEPNRCMGGCVAIDACPLFFSQRTGVNDKALAVGALKPEGAPTISVETCGSESDPIAIRATENGFCEVPSNLSVQHVDHLLRTLVTPSS